MYKIVLVIIGLMLTFPVTVSAKTQNIAQSVPKSYDMSWLKKVEPDHVCMVTNKYFADPQISVEVEGKTYYGCCSMCKGKLQRSEALREGQDPVSGNVVDKATAVIGSKADGTVYYFENEENMQEFNKRMSN